MEFKKTKLIELYLAFFRVGLFTFGGAYAMIPIIEKEVINRKDWATYDELLDYYAISQMTPGIIMVNVATFIGYKERGIVGGIVSTLGTVSPSLIIITSIASLITNFQSYPIVQSALKAIGACICAIMVSSMFKLGKSSIKNIAGLIISISAFCLGFFTNISIVLINILGIVTGLLLNIKEIRK